MDLTCSFKEMPASFFGIFKVLPTIMSVPICTEGSKSETGPLDWLISLKCLRSEFPNVFSYVDWWGERGWLQLASGTRSFICAAHASKDVCVCTGARWPFPWLGCKPFTLQVTGW